jgi:hypothetical protein
VRAYDLRSDLLAAVHSRTWEKSPRKTRISPQRRPHSQPPHGESARHPALHSRPTPSRHEPAYARG